MSNLEKIVEELSNLTIIQAAELSKLLEEKWGVSAAAPVVVASAGAAAVADVAAEKSNFDVVLSEVGDKKIEVIKAVKDVLGLSLGDAKKLVDTPQALLKQGVGKEEAEKIKATLEGAGATVNLK